MIELFAVSWLVIAVASLFGWAGFREHRRGIDGADVAAYRDGLEL
jgi:hypothetical protein